MSSKKHKGIIYAEGPRHSFRLLTLIVSHILRDVDAELEV